MNRDKLQKLQQNDIMVGRADAVNELLGSIPGEDPDRAGIKETPWRVAKMYDELYWGYTVDAVEILNDAKFADIPSDSIVLVQDIQFYSMCEHHMMPFFGKMHIAYIPKSGNVVGISKIARVAEVFARRLQVQERLASDIVHCIEEALDPAGVAVIIEAEHTCMTARGIQKPGTITKTATLEGVFKLNPMARQELYQLLNR